MVKLFTQYGSNRGLPPIDIPHVTPTTTKWNESIPLYVISINPIRQRRFTQRLRGNKAHIWVGTNGQSMDVNQLRASGRLATWRLSRGQIGCFDSHVRLWEKVVSDKTPYTIICEDDVNLIGNQDQMAYLNTLLDEVQTTNFDVLFLSWFRPDGGRPFTKHTRSQWTFCQLWSYVITLDGAKRLLASDVIRHIRDPVDVAMWQAHSRGTIKSIVAYPPLCLTVGESSSTRRIR